MNCGVSLRATRDNKGLEICNPNPGFQDEGQEQNLFADIFGGERAAGREVRDEDADKANKRSNTVIDVDIEE